jgi:hypothetical protein
VKLLELETNCPSNMRGNVAGVNGGDDLQQWFRDIPFVSMKILDSYELIAFK